MKSIPSLPSLPIERLHTPRGNGEILSRPALVCGVEYARKNAERLNRLPIHIGGRSLAQFRKWAREACLNASRKWMADNLDLEVTVPSQGLLFVTGHQPQLNHAGVWLKNVAAARLAECSSGIGLNLIVDNDLAGPPSIRCPAGNHADPRFEEVPYDELQPTQPWEEVQVQNPELLRSFADRVAEHLKPWGISPLLESIWPAAVAASQQSKQLSTVLSASRIAQERHWGIQNLELPVSEMCRTEPFLTFVAHLCWNFEKFFADYNLAVHDYRRKYRVRNHRHPVPDLEQRGDRFELPFWFWNPGDHDRSRVFVRKAGQGLELYANDQLLTRLESPDVTIGRLEKLQSSGRMRTRALTTTLFARLCLGDLFIHGIGGARYDEITDSIVRLFFEAQAPAFVTLTATLHLPLGPYEKTAADVSQLRGELRHLRFTGPADSDHDRVIALQIRRAELIAACKEDRAAGYSRTDRRARRSENRRRHLELVRIREELSQLATDEIQQKEQALETARQELRANSVLKSREFAACLFPAPVLHTLVDNLRRQICGRGL